MMLDMISEMFGKVTNAFINPDQKFITFFIRHLGPLLLGAARLAGPRLPAGSSPSFGKTRLISGTGTPDNVPTPSANLPIPRSNAFSASSLSPLRRCAVACAKSVGLFSTMFTTLTGYDSTASPM
jgi:hypothetical protein